MSCRLSYLQVTKLGQLSRLIRVAADMIWQPPVMSCKLSYLQVTKLGQLSRLIRVAADMIWQPPVMSCRLSYCYNDGSVPSPQMWEVRCAFSSAFQWHEHLVTAAVNHTHDRIIQICIGVGDY